jgi:hypothetical protein
MSNDNFAAMHRRRAQMARQSLCIMVAFFIAAAGAGFALGHVSNAVCTQVFQ